MKYFSRILRVTCHLERELGQTCTVVEPPEGESGVGMATGKKSKNRPDEQTRLEFGN